MSAATPKLWIVCPVYLDVDGFLAVRERCRAALAPAADQVGRLRFVAVDDTAGRDPDVARLAGVDDVRLVTPPFNLGHQRALVYGLRGLATEIAEDDLVVTLDADGEDRPEDVPRLLAPLLAAPADRRRIAVAQRTQRSESAGFKLLYFCFRMLFRASTGRLIRSGNFVAYRGWLVRHVLFHPHFDLCYSSSFVSLDLPVHFVPLARGQRYFGRSRMNLSRLLTHGVSMMMPFTERIAIRALVAAACGLGLTAAALIVIAVARLAWDLAAPRWVWTATALLGLFSFVALGNFLVLFAAFGQSRGSLLRGLERERDAGA